MNEEWESPAYEHCRECRDEFPYGFQERADFILWGKFFPPEALGPRCYEHTTKYMGAGMSQIDQYAVFDLRPIRALLEAKEDAS